MKALALKLVFALCLLTNGAQAHTRSQSVSTWTIDGSILSVTFNVTNNETTRLSAIEDYSHGLAEMLRIHLNRNISASAEGKQCEQKQSFSHVLARKGYLRLEAIFICDSSSNLRISNRAFFDVAPSHTHFARVQNNDKPSFDTIMTRQHTVINLAEGQKPKTSQNFTSFIKTGITHILSGYDHIAFLIGLLLLCHNLRSLVITISGFTIGHSITLSISALGIAIPNIQLIEALIGFTILIVGVEAVSSDHRARKWLIPSIGAALAGLALVSLIYGLAASPTTLLGLGVFSVSYLALIGNVKNVDRLRLIITLIFGLIHGFGFASALDILGLNTDTTILALLGFNIGVEIGQLMIIILLWIIGHRLLTALLSNRHITTGQTLIAATLGGLGSYWFIGRLLI